MPSSGTRLGAAAVLGLARLGAMVGEQMAWRSIAAVAFSVLKPALGQMRNQLLQHVLGYGVVDGVADLVHAATQVVELVE